jgi:hypothetical protein
MSKSAPNKVKPPTLAEFRRLPWPESLFRSGTMDTVDTYEFGRIIVERVQQGIPPRSRTPGYWSSRRIAEVLGLSSAATVARATQVYEVVQELGLSKDVKRLSTSLLFMVARLPKNKRRSIVDRALKGRWTRDQIQAKVSEVVPQRERTQPPVFLRALKALARQPFGDDLGRVHELDAETKRDAQKRVGRLLKDLERVRAKLG